MDEETLKSIAAQLRKPSGEHAAQIAQKMNEGNAHINSITVDALQLQSNENILEIGMGNGFFVKDLLVRDNTVKYVGCDYSEEMVAQAQEINAPYIATGQAAFYLADAQNLPFEGNTFDKAFTINTLYFWDDPTIVLSEIKRVLKPKGKIIIAIRPRSVMENYPFTPYGFNMFTAEELKEVVRSAQFRIIDIFEKEEPDVIIGGNTIKTSTLLVHAEKY